MSLISKIIKAFAKFICLLILSALITYATGTARLPGFITVWLPNPQFDFFAQFSEEDTMCRGPFGFPFNWRIVYLSPMVFEDQCVEYTPLFVMGGFLLDTIFWLAVLYFALFLGKRLVQKQQK